MVEFFLNRYGQPGVVNFNNSNINVQDVFNTHDYKIFFTFYFKGLSNLIDQRRFNRLTFNDVLNECKYEIGILTDQIASYWFEVQKYAHKRFIIHDGRVQKIERTFDKNVHENITGIHVVEYEFQPGFYVLFSDRSVFYIYWADQKYIFDGRIDPVYDGDIRNLIHEDFQFQRLFGGYEFSWLHFLFILVVVIIIVVIVVGLRYVNSNSLLKLNE
jgi:hypothetical protein